MHTSRLVPVIALTLSTFALLPPSCAEAQAIKTLRMNELAFSEVSGLTVEGVTFMYQPAAGSAEGAYINSFGPGQLTHVSDPSLTGTGGILTMDFAVPTSVLEFGAALSIGTAVQDAAQIVLRDADGNVLLTESVNLMTTAPLGFAEGKYSYGGALPIGSASIDWLASDKSFAIDNLTYAVPEPTSTGVLLVWLAAAAITTRRNRSSVS